MIKPLRSSDKIVRPFKTFKSWSYKNTELSDVILLEHKYYEAIEGGMVGEGDYLTSDKIKTAWNTYFAEIPHDFEEYTESGLRILKVVTQEDGFTIATYQEVDSRNTLLYESGYGAAPEEHDIAFGEFDIKVKHGKKLDGSFYPVGHRKYDSAKEPINSDGSYHRVIYNTIKHLFYNDYFVEHYDYSANKELKVKNPLMLFGVESAEYHDPTILEDIDTGEEYSNRRIERRVIGDEIKVLEISRKHFGEKIRPGSVKITDYSSEFEVINIIDDGYTNLITTEGTFDNVHRVGTTWADRIDAFSEQGQKFDPKDFSFGEKLKSSGSYFLTGCPMEYNDLSESQAGSAFLNKYDKNTDQFRTIRSFSCPFSQSGLALEQRHDHNNLLLKQLKDVLLANDYSLNDNFGNAIDLTEQYCAIGASRAHIRGESKNAPTGFVFVYERNKGGNDNWGMLNIIEGIPGSEFGASISISDNMMAIGSPGTKHGNGIVYIFKRTTRTTESAWNRMTDVPNGYTWDTDKKIFEGFPSGLKLEEINKNTTRWKVNSVIPDGTILNCFGDIGEFQFSDSIISGSFISGSLVSGSYTSGSGGSDLCLCELSTFGGEEIITHGTFREDDKEHDTGYPPHMYSHTPNQSVGDSTWVYDSYVEIETSDSCLNFGTEVKLVNDTLYVSTPNSVDQVCYVFNRTVSNCDKVEWNETHNISKLGILNKNSGLFNEVTYQDRELMVSHPYEYSEVKKNEYGKSIDANENYLVIGDPNDRVYATQEDTFHGGSAYVYELGETITFKEKLYGEKQQETNYTSRFGNSVSVFEGDVLIGSHCIDKSKIGVNESSIHIEDYYLGTETLVETTYDFYGKKINAVEGEAYYYRFSKNEETSTLLKKVKMNKTKNNVRRQFAYSVSLSSDYIYVGLPVIGEFPFFELTTFDSIPINAHDQHEDNPHEPKHRESLFAHYDKLNETSLQSEEKNLSGNVIAYRADSVRDVKNHQIGNIFYKNGIIVITDVSNHLKNILSGSFREGYEIEFSGSHTLYETEILCTVEPNEFNISTNPTSLLNEPILYDINSDGRFDIRDLIFIYKFLRGQAGSSLELSEIVDDSELKGGIAVEQDTEWPNSDILISESEDAILMFFERESDNVSVSEYEKVLPILKKLKVDGHFDADDDGVSASADAKLLIRYFKGYRGQDLIRGLINKKSRRRVPHDIAEFFDEKTGKKNGIEILPEFERYTDLDRIMTTGKVNDALCPYATTIGLYNGIELVAIAKLGKPTKITPNYPINFLIKYDG